MELADVKELTKQLDEAKSTLKKQQDELKEAHNIAMKAIEDGKKLAADQATNIDKAMVTANENGAQVKELAQRVDDAIKAMKAGPDRPMSFRQELEKSMTAEAKAVHDRIVKREATGSFRLTAKQIGMPQTVSLVPGPYVDTTVSLTRAPLRIRDLLTVIPVLTDNIRYAVQNTRTNAARIVAEGTAKPYSDYGWTEATANVEVIAHLAKLTLQAISDVPRLVAEIEAEMRFGLALNEEAELLNGNGTTGHLNGLRNQATPYVLPIGVDTGLILNDVDRLRVAQLQLQIAYVSPDGQVLNPIDVCNIELLRRDADTKHGGYIFGSPDQTRSVVTLWGVPTVQSPSMPVGNYLMGNFALAANLYQREGVTALISTENADDFEKNLATMRVEERLGLAVRRPYALVKGTLVGEGS